MPAPHSYDLRQRVMAHYARYGNASLTSRHFSINRSIIYDWKKQEAETGDVKAKSGYQQGHSHKIKDLAAFAACVKAHPGATLAALVKASGIAMSEMTCCRALKTLNITRKKRRLGIEKEMKPREKRTKK